MQNAMDVELYGDLFDEKRPGSASSQRDGGAQAKGREGSSGGEQKKQPSLKAMASSVSVTAAPLSTLRKLLVADSKAGKRPHAMQPSAMPTRGLGAAQPMPTSGTIAASDAQAEAQVG